MASLNASEDTVKREKVGNRITFKDKDIEASVEVSRSLNGQEQTLYYKVWANGKRQYRHEAAKLFSHLANKWQRQQHKRPQSRL